MNMKVQGSRNGKALGIGELSAPLDRSYYGYHTIIQRSKTRTER